MARNGRKAFDEITVEDYLNLKHEEKLTDEEISEQYFVGVATLGRWKRRNGVTSKRAVEDYISLRQDGYRDYQIASRWGVSPQNLYQWKRKRDLVNKSF